MNTTNFPPGLVDDFLASWSLIVARLTQVRNEHAAALDVRTRTEVERRWLGALDEGLLALDAYREIFADHGASADEVDDLLGASRALLAADHAKLRTIAVTQFAGPVGRS